MTIYISILRGINVSGQKSIKMADLKSLYESLKFQKVQTYIQSGNVVFDSPGPISSELIVSAIEKQFGFDVPVIVRSLSQWKKVIDSNPFLKNTQLDVSKMHVTFLEKPANETCMDRLNQIKHKDESIAINGEEIYLYCPNGYGKSKLSNNNIEKVVGSTATTRNWKTVNKLSEIGASLSA